MRLMLGVSSQGPIQFVRNSRSERCKVWKAGFGKVREIAVFELVGELQIDVVEIRRRTIDS